MDYALLMRKRIFLLLASLCTLVAQAADLTDYSKQQPMRISVYANYGYNYTYLNYGGVSAIATLPLNEHFELVAGIQALSTNIHTASANIRPLFPLPVGALYLDTRLLYTASFRHSLHDIAASVGIGYRMDYVDVQFGLQARMLNSFYRDKHSEDEIIFEAPHLLYGVEAFVRPQTSNWNISLRLANYDDFQIERMWQPIFRIGAYYDVNADWRVLADVTCKPTGMFHLNASFYDIRLRAGFAYTL